MSRHRRKPRCFEYESLGTFVSDLGQVVEGPGFKSQIWGTDGWLLESPIKSACPRVWGEPRRTRALNSCEREDKSITYELTDVVISYKCTCSYGDSELEKETTQRWWCCNGKETSEKLLERLFTFQDHKWNISENLCSILELLFNLTLIKTSWSKYCPVLSKTFCQNLNRTNTCAMLLVPNEEPRDFFPNQPLKY